MNALKRLFDLVTNAMLTFVCMTIVAAGFGIILAIGKMAWLFVLND